MKHRTGPAMPAGLQVLVAAPIILVAFGGLIGGLIGAGGVAANWFTARSAQPLAVKALLMVVALVVAFVVWLAVAAAITRA